MKMPCCLITSTSGAPSATSISIPSSLSLATAETRQPGLAGSAHGWLRLAGDLGVCARWRRYVLAAGLRLDELDHGAGRLEPVGVGVVVVSQEFVGEAGQLVLVVVHVIEPVDGVAEGAAGLDRLVGAGLGAEAAVHADAEVDLVADLVEAAVFARLRGDEDAAVRAGLRAGAAARTALV